jgi:hypothetical protein
MGIVVAIIVASIISMLFFYGFSEKGPWGTFWTFFVVILLTVWAASFWIMPTGMRLWGVEWILLFILGIMVALLLTSISRRKGYDPEEDELDEDVPRSKKRKEDDKLSLGWLVWLFMGLILLAAILGLVLDPRFR